MQVIHDRHLLYIPSREIERVLISQGQLDVPSPVECQAADFVHWPTLTLVGAYYDICFHYRQAPTQEQMISHYFAGNREHASESTKEVYRAMRKRVARAYNSLVAEHHLLSLCIESNRFDACAKSEQIDISSSVDLLLRVESFEMGFEIRVPTKHSDMFGEIKAERQEVRNRVGQTVWKGWVCRVRMNFSKMQQLAGIHLFTPIPWVSRIRQTIDEERRRLAGFGQLPLIKGD
ncbi:hypothetical protein ES703_112267 [subsurface metagenome]